MISTVLGYDWFISYCHGRKDVPSPGKAYAPRLATALSARPAPFRVCIDRNEFRGGKDLNLLTKYQVSRSRYLLVVMDQAAATSQWVLEEIRVARASRRTCIFIDLDGTYDTLPSNNPLRLAAGETLRRADAGGGPSADLIAQLGQDFTIERVETRERRIVGAAAILGFVLATIAGIFAWIASQRAAGLRDQLLISAAQRATDEGDTTHARLFLWDVGDPQREEWRRVAFSLGPPSAPVDWQAEEWLLGGLPDGSFATMDDRGWVHLRNVEHPAESIDLRWPSAERPSAGITGTHDIVAVSADGAVVAANVGLAAAIWKAANRAEPITTGLRIQMDRRRGWLLVWRRHEVELRSVTEPDRVLAQYSSPGDPPGSSYVWSDVGAAIASSSGRSWLLTRTGSEPFPFEIRLFDVQGLMLSSAALEVMPPVDRSPSVDGCIEATVRVRRLGAPWARLPAGSRDGWPICDVNLLPVGLGQHAIAWSRAGLLILRVAGDRVRSREVPWTMFPGCRVIGRDATCGLFIEPDGATVRVAPGAPPAQRRGFDSTAASWRVDLDSGHVTPVPPAPAVGFKNERQGPQKKYAIVWRGSGYDVAVDATDLLLWSTETKTVAPAPWRLDLPNSSAVVSEPRIVVHGDYVVAAASGVPVVRRWRRPPSSTMGQRHQNGWWLRDGRRVFHDAGDAPAALRLSTDVQVGAADRLVIELGTSWPCDEDDERVSPPRHWPPRQVAVTADGAALVMDASRAPIRALELRGGPARCLPLHESLQGARGGGAFDPAGRWVVTTGRRGIEVWSTSALNAEGRRLSNDLASNPVFSPNGRWLHTIGADSRVTLWDMDRMAMHRRIDTQGSGRHALAVDEGGRYVARIEPNAVRGYLLDVASAQETPLPAFSQMASRAIFSPDAAFLAATTFDHEVFVWSVGTPHAEPLRYAVPDRVSDLRWSDGSHLLLLLFDGTVIDLFLDVPRMKQHLGATTCALPAARGRWLKEEPQAARAAYEACVAPRRSVFGWW